MVAQNSNGREHSSYTNTQMVLKFAALNEFLDGGELIDYVTIQEKLKHGKTIELRLLPHPHLDEPPLGSSTTSTQPRKAATEVAASSTATTNNISAFHLYARSLRTSS